MQQLRKSYKNVPIIKNKNTAGGKVYQLRRKSEDTKRCKQEILKPVTGPGKGPESKTLILSQVSLYYSKDLSLTSHNSS